MIASQDLPSLKAWENIIQTPELVEYFDDVFNHLGITIEESGERFTIHHTDTSFEFEEGIVEDNVDFIVPLKKENISNMIRHAEDGFISPEESWIILDVLFTPLTKVTLHTPVLEAINDKFVVNKDSSGGGTRTPDTWIMIPLL